jgi:hypothetical protein
MVRADGDWPTARQAVLNRMSELGLRVETLARRTRLATSTIRYFGQAPAHAGTLEAIGAGLGWPPGYLLRIVNGESPRTAGPPHVTETVYRHVIVPAIRGGATVMDNVFGAEDEESA